ncbi:MAG: FAD-dependent oxidoreductase [Myxococcota bacterium]|nr:FAD-dependent oxidoreductase [Myxococcota bacterium]
MDSHRRALSDTQPACFWLDQDERPPVAGSLEDDDEADLVIVGGGFTGLWAALQAKEALPDRDIVLLEAGRIADGASGRNGGFADPSLTHGLANGLSHFPNEMAAIQTLAAENYRGFADSIDRYGIDARMESTGTLDVATAEYQVEGLREYHDLNTDHGERSFLLGQEAARAELNSPTYMGAVFRPDTAIVDPARLAWGLSRAVRDLGVRVYEQTPMNTLSRRGPGIEVRTPTGRVRGRKCLLATNAFKTPVRRMQRVTVPIWDYVLMTEPLGDEQLASLGWANRQGAGEETNQFHYYRLTADNRILWGGYDAIYHFGSDIRPSYEQRGASFEGLSDRFFATFPQLEGLRFSHSWGGPIASTTRFCLDAGSSHGGRVAWAAGYTGLGVVASRFGGQVALGLLDQLDRPELKLELVRKRPFPWPPEPIRSLVIKMTQRGLARADRNEGRRGPWLRLLDQLGLGFDS